MYKWLGDVRESLNPLGFADLKQLDSDEVAEKWKTYTVEAHSPQATEPRRLENARWDKGFVHCKIVYLMPLDSWRIWNMDKMRKSGSLSNVDADKMIVEEDSPSKVCQV